MRSYHAESTLIHSNQYVKSHRARLVLSWGTRWEARVTHVFWHLFSNIFSLHYFSRIVVYIVVQSNSNHMRSYHAESTLIHSNQEVKSHRARLELSWGTRWEARVTHVFFSLFANILSYTILRELSYMCVANFNLLHAFISCGEHPDPFEPGS